jgi:3D (Asp-Asp-Asp) domain-containing protein
MIQWGYKVVSSHGRGFFVGKIHPVRKQPEMTKSASSAKDPNPHISNRRSFPFSNGVKIILPILYVALIARPAFLGGSLWLNSGAVNVLPEVSQAVAASVPAFGAEPELKEFRVWLTAYSSMPEETDETPLITATNKTVRDGFIAANFLPFGTKVKIPEFFGDKVFVVEDRMSRRKTDFMDIWMPSKEKANEFGIHRANVIVVEMGTIPNPLPNPFVVKSDLNENPAID